MRPEIGRLYAQLIEGSSLEYELLEFLMVERSFLKWLNRLYDIEVAIGGYGSHNIDRFEGAWEAQHITGTYHAADRPIYRPLQYCAFRFQSFFIHFDTRSLIELSGAHIEGLLARAASAGGVVGLKGRPLGALISGLRQSSQFDDEESGQLLNAADALNKVYRNAKHNWEDYSPTQDRTEPLRAETHMFSYDEAMVYYFGARVTGLSWAKMLFARFREPKSMAAVPRIPKDEYLRICELFSYSIARWDPELLTSSKHNIDDELGRRSRA